jgi:hypothetical protein
MLKAESTWRGWGESQVSKAMKRINLHMGCGWVIAVQGHTVGGAKI